MNVRLGIKNFKIYSKRNRDSTHRLTIGKYSCVVALEYAIDKIFHAIVVEFGLSGLWRNHVVKCEAFIFANDNLICL